MTKNRDVVDVVAKAASKTGVKAVAGELPVLGILDGVAAMHQAQSDFKRLREEERTKRVAILADRDASIEQIRAQRDVIKQALSDAFELRKTGLQAQIQAMDKAIDGGNLDALHVVMDAMVKTIQSSPFKDLADMREQLSDRDFTLRLK